MNIDVIKNCITNMSECGVKSIVFSGEGEPTLHKGIVKIIKHAYDHGLDIGLTTNGSMFTSEMTKNLSPYLKWIKFSVDALNPIIYADLHGVGTSYSKSVLDNISRTSFYKRLKSYNCMVGVQAIVLKDNILDLPKLAKYLKYLKVDYFVMKPFSDHEKRLGDKINLPTDKDLIWLEEEVKQYETNNYKIIFRKSAFDNLNKPKIYKECYGQDFIAHITTLGGVYSCINYIGNKKYEYGNIYEKSFKDIWKNKFFIKPDFNECRSICRLDNINEYLWELKNPDNHVNFI